MTTFKAKFILLSTLLSINLLYASLNIVVSILPQKTFIEAIGGNKINVSIMVKPGSSPHNYEPKPSQMANIEKANLYFAIGIEFEKVWLSKFADQNKKMKISHIDRGILKIDMEEHHHHDEDGHGTHHNKNNEENTKERDPHIWTSPLNVKLVAKNIYNELITIDKENKAYYTSNYEKFLAHINTTDQNVTDILKNVKTEKKFIVFHPAWGYFARDYGLTQIAIEVSGKSPKPRQIMHLIEEAKKEKVNAILAAPEFSDKTARIIAKEVGLPVVKLSPLDPKWSKNLINLAKAIAHKQ